MKKILFSLFLSFPFFSQSMEIEDLVDDMQQMNVEESIKGEDRGSDKNVQTRYFSDLYQTMGDGIEKGEWFLPGIDKEILKTLSDLAQDKVAVTDFNADVLISLLKCSSFFMVPDVLIEPILNRLIDLLPSLSWDFFVAHYELLGNIIDQKGFSYLCNLIMPYLGLNLTHSVSPSFISWSPDGKSVAISTQKSVKIWNIDTAKCERELKHEYEICALSWSPDGRCLAIGSWEIVKIWDSELEKWTKDFIDHHFMVTALTWSSDGKYLISGAADRKIKIWDVEQEICEKTFSTNETVLSMSLSPDSTYLAVTTDLKNLYVWDIRKKELFWCVKNVEEVSWSPDGKYLVGSGSSKEIQIFNFKKREKERILFDADFPLVWFEDRVLAAISIEGIKFWNIVTGECKKIISGFKMPLISINMVSDEKCVALGSLKDRLFLFNSNLNPWEGLFMYNVLNNKQEISQEIWTDISDPYMYLPDNLKQRLLAKLMACRTFKFFGEIKDDKPSRSRSHDFLIKLKIRKRLDFPGSKSVN